MALVINQADKNLVINEYNEIKASLYDGEEERFEYLFFTIVELYNYCSLTRQEFEDKFGTAYYDKVASKLKNSYCYFYQPDVYIDEYRLTPQAKNNLKDAKNPKFRFERYHQYLG